MESLLSVEEIRHVAILARLTPGGELDEQEIEQYQRDLTSVLAHLRRLDELNLDDVEPLAGVHETTGRLAPDEPGEPLPVEQLLANAPATEGRYLAVPKVIDSAAAAGGDETR